MNKYIAFLRGINVSGHHKVPMAQLRTEMETLHFEKVVTILNSGNIIFNSSSNDLKLLEKTISDHLEKIFSFPVPAIIRSSEMIEQVLDTQAFRDIEITKDIRLYVSFLKSDVKPGLSLPWTSADNAYQIIDKIDHAIFSILDLSVTKTPKGMEALEKFFGKDITTRNWNTIKRIGNKLGLNY